MKTGGSEPLEVIVDEKFNRPWRINDHSNTPTRLNALAERRFAFNCEDYRFVSAPLSGGPTQIDHLLVHRYVTRVPKRELVDSRFNSTQLNIIRRNLAVGMQNLDGFYGDRPTTRKISRRRRSPVGCKIGRAHV